MKRARWTLALATLTSIIGVKMGPATLGPTLAYIGAGLTMLTGTVRAGVYYDFYSRRSNADNQGTPTTQKYEKYWSKTPLRHLSLWKIENDRRDETLRALFKKLDERINAADDDGKKDARKKDNKAYTRILDALNPNHHLMPAASGGLIVVSWGRSLLRSFHDGTLSLWQMAAMVPSMLAAIAFTFVHLGTYAVKKQANGTSNPLFDNINNQLEKTPLNYLTAWKLRRQLKKIDALDVSDELVQDMCDLALDSNFEVLIQKSRYTPNGLLVRIFNVKSPVIMVDTAPKETDAVMPPAEIITPDTSVEPMPGGKA
ncbi:MAG: hypothetical protein LRY57_02500 [Alphaproteobacteria bacterium]|nr:hypothetical protein [Alphaproteobacteria bacterium]